MIVALNLGILTTEPKQSMSTTDLRDGPLKRRPKLKKCLYLGGTNWWCYNHEKKLNGHF